MFMNGSLFTNGSDGIRSQSIELFKVSFWKVSVPGGGGADTVSFEKFLKVSVVVSADGSLSTGRSVGIRSQSIPARLKPFTGWCCGILTGGGGGGGGRVLVFEWLLKVPVGLKLGVT